MTHSKEFYMDSNIRFETIALTLSDLWSFGKIQKKVKTFDLGGHASTSKSVMQLINS